MPFVSAEREALGAKHRCRDSGVSNGLSRSRAENLIMNVFPNDYRVTSAESICVRKNCTTSFNWRPLVSGYQNGQIGPMLLNILEMMQPGGW